MIAEGGNILRIKAVQPPVEGIARDAEPRAGFARGSMLGVVEQPSQTFHNFRRQVLLLCLLQECGDLASVGALCVYGGTVEGLSRDSRNLVIIA